jgi:large subunit ribosomal protein L25
MMGNKLYVTKLVSDKYKLVHQDNTVVAHFSAAMATQEAANGKRSSCKGKKIIFFHSYLKASVVKLVLFY